MTIWVNWRGPPGEVPPAVYKGPPALPFFLAPKAVEPSDVIEIPAAMALIDWSMRPVGAEPMILIWGRADYEDVYGKRHFIEWCHQLRFSRPTDERMRAGFIQWREHNRSDDNDERQ